MEDRSGSDREQTVSAGSHQRIATRDSMFLQAQIVRDGKAELQLRVRNLSAGGMMVETDHIFVPGETMTVHLRSLDPIGASVAWARPPRVGITFDQPINPKLARKAPPQSPGAGLLVTPASAPNKRPGLRDR